MIDPQSRNPNVELAAAMPENIRREVAPGKFQDIVAPAAALLPAPNPNPGPMVVDVRRGGTSASNAPADSLCPGRHVAQRGIADRITDYTESGNRIHAALAGKLDPASLVLDEREIFDACREIEAKVVHKVFGGQRPAKTFRHERYWGRIQGAGNSVIEHSGEVDVIHRLGPKGLILDYKTLTGDVQHSPMNQQLRDLAVLAKGNLFLSEVVVAIVQPLVTWDPELCTYDESALARSETEMWQRIVKSNDPASQRIAGDLQCKFCKAALAGKCVEHQQFAGAMVLGALSILGVPAEQWTPEQRATFLERRAVAQKWLDDCKELMERLIEKDPDAIPGWRLEPGDIREPITNPQEVFNRFVALGGNADQFVSSVTVTKATLRDLVAKLTGHKGKRLSGTIAALTDGCVDRKRSKASLAKIPAAKEE